MEILKMADDKVQILSHTRQCKLQENLEFLAYKLEQQWHKQESSQLT